MHIKGATGFFIINSIYYKLHECIVFPIFMCIFKPLITELKCFVFSYFGTLPGMKRPCKTEVFYECLDCSKCQIAEEYFLIFSQVL